MATTGQPEASAPAASDVAASCRDAGLVELVGAARGDALAAVGLVAAALDEAGVPFQTQLLDPAAAPGDATDADLTIALGRTIPGASTAFEASPVRRAYAVASALAEPDPVLALAGVLAGGGPPDGRIHEDAMAAGVERRPGLAIPTAEPADGLAHSTLVHGPFSGDTDAAGEALDGIDPDDGRALASVVALEVAAAAESPAAGAAIERVLRPYAGGPVETVGGYADVLDALARRQPGRGIALALGHGEPAEAMDTWRAQGRAVHETVGTASTRRLDGLVVATADAGPAALEPAARLLRDYRAPEPAVLLRGAGRTVLATGEDGDAATRLRAAAADRDEPVVGDARLATIPAAGDDLEAAVEAAIGRER